MFFVFLRISKYMVCMGNRPAVCTEQKCTRGYDEADLVGLHASFLLLGYGN